MIASLTPTFLYRNRLYKKLIEGRKDKTFFEIGTGNGYLLTYLDSDGHKGYSIDISRESIQRSKRFLSSKSKIRLEEIDFYRVKTSERYNQVFCFEVLEHVKDDRKFLSKIVKHIKPGGSLLLSVPAHKNAWNRIDEIKGHFRRYEKKELSKMLEQSGFEIIKFWSYGFPISNLLRRINYSAQFIKGGKGNKRERSEQSSLVQEYNPGLNFLTHPFILNLLFLLMDLFLNTDLGIGYLVEARYCINT